jgi:hypothetical protein
MVTKTLVPRVAIAVVLLSAGCGILTRLTVAPTVDTLGNVGMDARVSITPGISNQGPRAGDLGWFGVDAGIGGSYLGFERAGAAQVRAAAEASIATDPLFIRMGLGYSGRFTGPLSDCMPVPLNAGSLQGPLTYLGLDVPLYRDSGSPGSIAHVALGPELTGEYLVNTAGCILPARGLFSLGLSLSMLFQIW